MSEKKICPLMTCVVEGLSGTCGAGRHYLYEVYCMKDECGFWNESYKCCAKSIK